MILISRCRYYSVWKIREFRKFLDYSIICNLFANVFAQYNFSLSRSISYLILPVSGTTTRGVPKRSPIQVLTAPDAARLPRSNEFVLNNFIVYYLFFTTWISKPHNEFRYIQRGLDVAWKFRSIENSRITVRRLFGHIQIKQLWKVNRYTHWKKKPLFVFWISWDRRYNFEDEQRLIRTFMESESI